jgi:hypothetical protein
MEAMLARSKSILKSPGFPSNFRHNVTIRNIWVISSRQGAAPAGPGGMEAMLARALTSLGVHVRHEAAPLLDYGETQRTSTVLALSLLTSLAVRFRGDWR